MRSASGAGRQLQLACLGLPMLALGGAGGRRGLRVDSKCKQHHGTQSVCLARLSRSEAKHSMEGRVGGLGRDAIWRRVAQLAWTCVLRLAVGLLYVPLVQRDPHPRPTLLKHRTQSGRSNAPAETHAATRCGPADTSYLDDCSGQADSKLRRRMRPCQGAAAPS